MLSATQAAIKESKFCLQSVPVYDIINHERNDCIMKKMVLLFMVFNMLLSVVGCSNVNIDSNDTSETPVNFDLTQYDAHGELSCGLIWIEKTESSYDKAPETSFAYLDISGNVKSPWFSSKDYQKNDFFNKKHHLLKYTIMYIIISGSLVLFLI